MKLDTDKAQAIPCPFCGKSDIVKQHDDGLAWMQCGDCGATGPANTKYAAEDDPIWETRAARSAGLGQEPVYMTRPSDHAWSGSIHSAGWLESSEDVYAMAPENSRRILYATPSALAAPLSDSLNSLADKVVASNATGNEILFLAAVTQLIAAIRTITAATENGQ